jgi:hypothetical protein
MRTRKLLRLWSPVLVAATIACGRSPAPEDGPASANSTAERPTEWNARAEPLPLPASGASSSPQLTSSSRGIVLSWIEQSGSTATLKFAERTGGEWSEPRTVASGSDWFLSWADVPSVMRMSDGTLVANWYPATDPLIEAYDIRMSYSRDDGRTWARPFAPHHDSTTTQHGFVSLFELPDRTLGLVWLDGREQETNASAPDGGAMGLYYARFDNQWKQTAEAPVNARVCECCPTSAAVTADGVITAFRDRSPREIRDINVTRLEAGAWTPERPVHVDGWEIEACPVNGPALSARGRQVAAAWFTAAQDQGQALAAFSSDAGRTWSDPVRLDDGAPRGHVDVELLDDGSAIATWVELADERSRFRMRRVEPSGARSEAVDVAAERVTGYPRVARSGDELVFAWTESAEGEGAEHVKGAVARIPRTTAPR